MGTFDFLKNYPGVIKVNGELVKKSEIDSLEMSGKDLSIDLIPKTDVENVIEVRGWMTVENDNNLAFHERWNNKIAIPERVMFGRIVNETPSMYEMELSTLDERETWKGFVAKVAILSMEDL